MKLKFLRIIKNSPNYYLKVNNILSVLKTNLK